MRTNIDIDDDLLAEAMRATGLKTKKGTVEEGLRRLAQGPRYARMLALQGAVRWEGDLEAMRTDVEAARGGDIGQPVGGAALPKQPARRR